MSFILDALRKSEHARQRQTGPGLAEVPVAAARPRTNAWAAAAIALLVVNLLAVGVYLLRRSATPEAPPETATNAAPTAAAPGTANSARTPPPAAGAPTPGPVTQGAAPARAVAIEPPAAGRNPLADEVGDGEYDSEPDLSSAAAAVPAGPAAVVKNGNVRRGSVVYAPIPEAAEDPYSPAPDELSPQAVAAPAAAPASSALPGADEVAARGAVPNLHLDLHVYAPQPQQRFIFVNSRRYREGDTLTEGPVVEEITPDGAVLSLRGSRFRLSND